jgi:hypothetical protein
MIGIDRPAEAATKVDCLQDLTKYRTTCELEQAVSMDLQ